MTAPRSAALVGNPNAGKSALFNALTGARQKIANYPGVTVERKAGRLVLPGGDAVELTDLPGSYGLNATSPDEEVTRRVILGELPGESAPDVLVLVLDAANLEQHLVFAQEVIALGRPSVVALNMVDLAERDGLVIDHLALEQALGVPVVPTVAVRRRGLAELTAAIAAAGERESDPHLAHVTMTERRVTAQAIADAAIVSETARHRLHAKLDKLFLHPWLGPLILFALLFVVFQAVFAGATPFADALEALVTEQYLSGESLQVKMLSATGLGRLAESAATADSYTFAGRMIRPYPPGNVRVNNVMWPTAILGQMTLTWAHRDRMQQTVYLVTQSEGNVGPEAGVTYTVRFYNENNTLQKTLTGLTTTAWTYLTADEATDSGLGRINGKFRVEIEAVRAGYTSWQKQTRSVERAGYGLNYGKYYGGI